MLKRRQFQTQHEAEGRQQDRRNNQHAHSQRLSALNGVEPWLPVVAAVEDPAALRVEAFGPYFRCIRFGTRGLAGRLVDERDRGEAVAMSEMAAAFFDPWKDRRAH